jgi:hypothetical protein
VFLRLCCKNGVTFQEKTHSVKVSNGCVQIEIQ